MSDNTASGFVAVTPDDNNNIAKSTSGNFPRALRFGTGGSCVIVAPDGSQATFTNIANGETLSVNAKRVNVTGLTGCANIVGFY
jgi:hypothetical protein